MHHNLISHRQQFQFHFGTKKAYINLNLIIKIGTLITPSQKKIHNYFYEIIIKKTEIINLNSNYNILILIYTYCLNLKAEHFHSFGFYYNQ